MVVSLAVVEGRVVVTCFEVGAVVVVVSAAVVTAF